ncbi:MAG TPA: DUF2497 domain-containing protein [Sphingomonadaceae bacterium]|nr:DUF2497 domain-containing protein [Sphingomonadaceae bacterium]
MDARNDPSMEEILASIKRIIAEDGGPGPAAGRGRLVRSAKPKASADDKAQPGQEGQGEDDTQAEVLELTQAMPATAAENKDTPVELENATDAGRAAAPDAALPSSIVSDDAAHASRQALAALSAMIVKPSAGSDNSLEGLVRDMLRPMLKEWLDAKLPAIVEEMVSQEIARISGRAL